MMLHIDNYSHGCFFRNEHFMQKNRTSAGYKILQEHKTVLQCINGDFYLSDLIALQDRLSNDQKYCPDYNVIADLVDANLIAEISDVDKYTEYIKNNPRMKGVRRVAYITSRPNEVVLSTLFSQQVKRLAISVNVFSTIEAALLWLEYPSQARDELVLNLQDLKVSI